jgi:hypothetical protein
MDYRLYNRNKQRYRNGNALAFSRAKSRFTLQCAISTSQNRKDCRNEQLTIRI